MEVGQVIRVAGPPTPSPGPGGTYSVPVRIQGGIHRAMVDSGCTQSIIHQNLVRPGTLVEASWVDIRCVHGDIHRYVVVPVEIRYKGKKHTVKAAVSSRLTHPLVLGTDWTGFNRLVGQCAGVRSRPVGLWDMCAVLSGDTRLSDTAEGEGGPVVPPPEAPQVPMWRSTEDFPLEQSRDSTLRFAFDQVIQIDGQLVRPDAVQTYPHFALVRDRLYRVSRDTQTAEEITQLLVPDSRRETVFQAAHYNPMAGHMGYEKTLNRIMARFYWPGIRADVSRWCASCSECQLVNQPAIPRAPLRPLPLVEVPFERIGMDLIRPFHRSARGYRFVLVLVDYATRYPEVPLRTISAKGVAQALFQVISRVGIPKEILTDQGTSFMSRTLGNFMGCWASGQFGLVCTTLRPTALSSV
uniref:Gypsy retrotransposon integrase-like protein 1 n=1 Tax=Dicentrarchus labrax TaxID=13489 RepID=A0A8P4KG28_DICLA